MITESPLVSVIIPVYNSEKFIDNCIRSVIGQSYKNIEIIVVDDGSIDGSRSIIKRLQQTDNRIIFIDKQKNEGTVLTRKSGSTIAKGKYIQYLDGDDSLLKDAIERLVNRAEETNADIVAAPFYFCYPGKKPVRSVNLQFNELSGKEYYHLALTERAFWSVWSNFLRRDLEEKYYTTILPEISIVDDVIMMVQLILNADKVAAIYEPTINYNKHDSSITAQIDKSKYAQLRMADTWVEKYVEAKGLKTELAYGLAQRQLRVVFAGIHWHLFQYADGEMRQLIKNLETYPDLRSLLTGKERSLLVCYRISPLLMHLAIFLYKIKMSIYRLLNYQKGAIRKK